MMQLVQQKYLRCVTRDELQSTVNNISSDSIILNSTNGTADAGDFLVLDGTDGSSSNANHRILFDETFVDKVGLFNINTLGSAEMHLKLMMLEMHLNLVLLVV